MKTLITQKNAFKLTQLAGAASLAIAMMVPAANAFVVTTSPTTVGIAAADVGSSFNISWLVPSGTGTLTQDVSATGIFTVSSFTSTTLGLGVSLSNTTVLTQLANAGLTSIGINFDPATITAASFGTSGAYFDGVELTTTSPAFGNVEVCAYSANNCAGGAQGNLLPAGSSDVFSLLLTGDFGLNPFVTLSTFGAKFQTSEDSYEVPGTSSSTSSTSGQTSGSTGTTTSSTTSGQNQVPEPGVLGLLGIGLLGQALLLRQRRRRLQQQ